LLLLPKGNAGAAPPHQNGRVWRDFVGRHSNMALVLVGATIIMYKVN